MGNMPKKPRQKNFNIKLSEAVASELNKQLVSAREKRKKRVFISQGSLGLSLSDLQRYRHACLAFHEIHFFSDYKKNITALKTLQFLSSTFFQCNPLVFCLLSSVLTQECDWDW